MWRVVKQVPGDLTNDVGKMLFLSLLTYALGDRLGQAGEVIRRHCVRGTTVLWVWMYFLLCRWLSTTTQENQQCCLSASAEFSDCVEAKFTVSFSVSA